MSMLEEEREECFLMFSVTVHFIFILFNSWRFSLSSLRSYCLSLVSYGETWEGFARCLWMCVGIGLRGDR